MKSNLLFLSIFLFCLACSSSSEEAGSTGSEAIATSPQKSGSNLRDTFDCELYGKADKRHALWMADKELYIRMSSDEFSEDMATATDFNVLQIYDTKSCDLLYNGKLPLVKGTKHPYKLQTDLYEPVNQLICAQGVDYAFCYNIDNRHYLVPMNAQAKSDVLQSISPDVDRDLSIYGRHLFGWTAGLGIYAFNMVDQRNPSNEMPVASFSDGKKSNYLYLIDVKGGKQLVIPSVENKQVIVEPILKKAMNLGRRVVRAGSGGRFAILRANTGNSPIIVDVQNKSLYQLPSKVDPGTASVKKYLDGLK